MNLTVIDPSTGSELHQFPCDTDDSVEQKLQQAQDAWDDWRRRSFAERGAVLRAVAAHMRAQRETLARPMTEEMGKPVKEALGEVDKAAWCAEHYAEHAEGYLASEEIESDASKSLVRYTPLGPVLGILPWNAPFWLAFRFCAPALMAGNTCLMKHDAHVPACAQAIIGAFEASGAPAGIMQALYLDRAEVEPVIRDRRIQALSFTGSSQGGAAVAAIAASEIKPAVLELGGSDPCIVLESADLEQAVEAICISRIINAGQSCIAAKRIIVEEPVYEDVVNRIKERLSKLRVGDPRLPETDVGPIARDDLRQNLHRQVSETIAAGARCLLGGTLPDGDGFFYPVTLLADVLPDHCAYREETFGPVMAVIKADDQAQALEMANDTEYGLAASVWGEGDTALALAEEIQAGQIVVNGVVKTDPRLPSGGIKRSGYGRELGPHGIHEFVNAQQMWIGPKQG